MVRGKRKEMAVGEVMQKCRSCGDMFDAVKYRRSPNGILTKPKCHCWDCYLEIVWGTFPRGIGNVPTMDTRSGGGTRVMRNNKALQ